MTGTTENIHPSAETGAQKLSPEASIKPIFSNEPPIPDGYYAANWYPDGTVGYQPEPPSVREQRLVADRNPRRRHIPYRELDGRGKLKRIAGIALRVGGAALFVAGCVPVDAATQPAPKLPDVGFGPPETPDIPTIAPIPTHTSTPTVPVYIPPSPTPTIEFTSPPPTATQTEVLPTFTPSEPSPTPENGQWCHLVRNAEDIHNSIVRALEQSPNEVPHLTSWPMMIWSFGDDPRTPQIEEPVCHITGYEDKALVLELQEQGLNDERIDECRKAVIDFWSEENFGGPNWYMEPNTMWGLGIQSCTMIKRPITPKWWDYFIHSTGTQP